ncbi:hypothetical protein WBG78_07000 [Chryseolinea sp. T2]|uniref:hypothetical protein n=1 Tax=Chryseolinea sp. T2 TaxID=3129255 RepID=UPI0030789E30
MEQQKTSKKALRNLIEDSMQDALKGLQLPEPGKKVRKVLHRNSKKLAAIFVDVIKREDRKKRKAAKFMESAVGKSKKKDKKKNEVLAEAELAAV